MKCIILQKQFPENKELVLIRIKKIMPHGAYAELVEYGKDAYLPISEIASGWIKNIHEFVKDGQRDVGKVISVDREKGSIDVSLKKATSKEKSNKMTEYGLEKRYEKLFEQAASDAGIKDKKDVDALREEIASKVDTYSNLIAAAQEDSKNIAFVQNRKFCDALIEIIAKNIKPKVYEVSYLMEMRSSNKKADIKTIRNVLSSMEKLGVEVLYLGAPRYRLTADGDSYLTAEGKIKAARNALDAYSGKLSYEMKNEKHD